MTTGKVSADLQRQGRSDLCRMGNFLSLPPVSNALPLPGRDPTAEKRAIDDARLESPIHQPAG